MHSRNGLVMAGAAAVVTCLALLAAPSAPPDALAGPGAPAGPGAAAGPALEAPAGPAASVVAPAEAASGRPSARALSATAAPARPAVAARQAPVAPPVEVVAGPPEEAADVGRVDRSPSPRASVASPPASTKRVVVGSDDYLFISQDWTVACQYAGKAAQAAAAIAEVTRVLRDSGRPTVLAIGPNKASVMTAQVPADGVPQRACGEQSSREYWDALTRDGGPSVLDLRPALRQASRNEQTYWRLDTHWSPTGGSVFARELARVLDPSLLVALGGDRGTYRLDGDLARTLGRPEIEEIGARTTTNEGVSFTEAPPRSVGLRNVVRSTTTQVGPGGRVVPGRTVFVGDSFTAIAVEQLAPLFEQAVFVWAIPGDPLQPVLDELEAADRVVLESVERVGWQFRMIGPDVAPALRGLSPAPDL